MLIGNGVFPNVYIDNIMVYEHEVRFDVFVLDSEEQPVWSNKKYLRDKLQIKIYCPINDQALSDGITLGESAFTKNDENVISYYLFDFHSSVSTEGTFAGHKIYRKTIVKQVPQDLNDLSIFSNLFIDQDEGTITGETVIVNNTISQTTNILLKNDTQYYGPAHLHDGVYMEGATHTDRPHSTLRVVSLPNLKIKDLRRYSYDYKKQANPDRIPIFSNLIKSYYEDTKHNFMFFANMEEVVITRTKYGRMLRSADESIFQEIVNRIKIRFLKIDRKRVNSYFRETVGGAKKKSPSRVIETTNVLRASESSARVLYGATGESISFVSHEFGNSIYGFFFNDNIDDHTPGDYQYLLEFSFDDPTIIYIRSILVDIKNSIEQANRYLEVLARADKYDYFMKKPKQSFADSIPYQSDLDVTLPEIINRAKKMMFNISEQESEKDLIRMYGLLNHKACSLESVGLFIEEAESVLSKYLQFFELNEQKIKKNYFNASSPGHNAQVGRIQVEHKFKEIITPSDSRYHYSYESSVPREIGQVIPVSNVAFAFGTRGNRQNFNFNTNKSKAKFNDLINKANGRGTSKSSTTISVSTAAAGLSVKEKHIKSAEYLGSESTFHTKETKDKCKTEQYSSNLTDEMSIGVETGNYNLQDTAAIIVRKEIEILSGFEKSNSGRNLINKPIWRLYNNEIIEGTTIVKHKRDYTIPNELIFSHPNEYVLLNNNSNIGMENHTPRPSVIRNMSNKARPYDMSLSSNNIVENGKASSVADYTPRSTGTPRPQTTTNAQPSSQGTAMQPVSQVSTTGGSTY